MPIDLTNIIKNHAPIISYQPSFFNKDMTGNKPGSGIFTNNLNPLNATLSTTENQDTDIVAYNVDYRQKVYTRQNHSSVRLNYITVDPYYQCVGLKPDDYTLNINAKNLANDHQGKWLDLPVDPTSRIFKKISDTKNIRLAVRLVPFRFRLRKVSASVAGKIIKTNSAIVAYKLQILIHNINGANKDVNVMSTSDVYDLYNDDLEDCIIKAALNADTNGVNDHATLINCYTTHARDIMINPSSISLVKLFGNQTISLLQKYLASYNLYTAVSNLSEAYQTHFADLLKFKTARSGYSAYDLVSSSLKLANGLRLPLDQYQKIYQFIKSTFTSQNTIDDLLATNLNLKFNSILSDLNQIKSQLALCSPAVKPQVSPKLSLEQRRAVTTSGPLTLIEAGAGTGKSSVILNRIKYLIDSGIKPNTIQVLSFTNAAADHIKDLYPDINSSTIASLIAQIYDDNFPGQTIVSPRTFLNTLNIAYGGSQNPLMEDFIDAVRLLTEKPDRGEINELDEGYRRLSQIIKQHPKLALGVCKTLSETTLDLQILICYTFLDKLKLTDVTKAKFLLVDEVQDNSIFEFMFLLKYTIINKASFFIVGDASQTLYEFRNANPRAMNVLESSSVFDIFKLETNFRSRQEILKFANVLLDESQSNYFARIQLKANSLRSIDANDFKHNVRYCSLDLNAYKDSQDMATGIAKNPEIQTYIKNCLKRGENVAVLAWSRRHVWALQQAFKSSMKCDLKNISARHFEDNTLFSGYWANLSKDRKLNLSKCQTFKQMLKLIKDALLDHNPDPHYQVRKHEDRDFILNQWDNFIKENSVMLDQLNSDFTNNKITGMKTIKQIAQLMLDSEINNNRRRQSVSRKLNSIDERQKIIKNSKLIFSTIHSVKGLEFDNVILYLNSTHLLEKESQKRLYYVGLTRAKNSELVIDGNFDGYNNSLMYTNYYNVLSSL